MTIATLVLASAGLAVAGCSGNNNAEETTAATDTATPAQTIADAHTSAFLNDVILTNNDEIKLGQLAADNGSTKEVRDFGQMLVTDHTAANATASQLASSMGVAVPTSTTPEADAEYTKLQGLKGADFDKEFASAMAAGHQKAIDKFKAEAGSTDPAPVIDFANQTLPTLQHHLDTAKSLQTT
jgi:putative membrane protein